MATYLVTGLTGSGKSAFLCSLIVKAIEENRHILTNLSLSETLYAKYPKAEMLIHLFADPLDVSPIAKSQTSNTEYPLNGFMVTSWESAPEWMNGALIIIDEAQSYFRPGQNIPERARDLLDRNRKLGLDIYFAAPGDGPEVLSPDLRRRARFHYKISKLSDATIFGFLPLPPITVISEYIGISKNRNSLRRFDPKPYFDLYNTTGGTVGCEPPLMSDKEPRSNLIFAKFIKFTWAFFLTSMVIISYISFQGLKKLIFNPEMPKYKSEIPEDVKQFILSNTTIPKNNETPKKTEPAPMTSKTPPPPNVIAIYDSPDIHGVELDNGEFCSVGSVTKSGYMLISVTPFDAQFTYYGAEPWK